VIAASRAFGSAAALIAALSLAGLMASCAVGRRDAPAENTPVEAGESIEASESSEAIKSIESTARAPEPSARPKPAQREAVDGVAPPQRPPNWTALTPLVRVDRDARMVEFDAVAVLDVGFLEQLVCMVGTREHESIFAFEGKPSEVHAALLVVGAEPGRPGRWREVALADGSVTIEGVPAEGTEVALEVELPDGSVRPIEWFMRASPISSTTNAAPPSRFVFAGSRFLRNPRTQEERYAADGSGSLVGLVTFGDETIGAVEVIPDSAQAAAPVWEVFSERVPAPGTRVKIRARPRASVDPRTPSGDSATDRSAP
jgi:hypothetical protein